MASLTFEQETLNSWIGALVFQRGRYVSGALKKEEKNDESHNIRQCGKKSARVD